MTTPLHHTSVLLAEAVNALQPQSGKVYGDLTLGGGGHTLALCGLLNETNTVIGLDQDPVALGKAKEALKDVLPKVVLIQGNFGEVARLVTLKVDGGVLLDLGVSDFQLKVAERGFSFRQKAPLDMRMNPESLLSASELVNTWPEKELADLFYLYGDEKLSRPIARAIVEARPIEDTVTLAKLVETLYRQKGVKARNIHPATRVFQALRIAVNRELEQLESCLGQLPALLAPGARVAIITFHSGEDKIVKKFFKTESATCICPPGLPVCRCHHQPTFKVIGKPISPGEEECRQNPQARSAKLRVAERV